MEKEELRAGLEEAEAALEQEENKVLRAQLEMSQVRRQPDEVTSEAPSEKKITLASTGRDLANIWLIMRHLLAL